jgi:hypothetical protein
MALPPESIENHFDAAVPFGRLDFDVFSHTDSHSDQHSDQHSDRHGDHSDEGPPHDDHYDDGPESLFNRFEKFFTVLEQALAAQGNEVLKAVDQRSEAFQGEATRLFDAQAARIAALEQRIAELER